MEFYYVMTTRIVIKCPVFGGIWGLLRKESDESVLRHGRAVLSNRNRNAIVSHMKLIPRNTLLQRYADLTEPFQLLLQLRALTGSLSSRGLVLDTLQEAKIPAPHAKVWSTTELSAAGNTLQQLNLTDKLNQCHPALEHEMALELATSNGKAAQEIRTTLLRLATAHIFFAARLRLMIYLGNAKGYADTLAEVSSSLLAQRGTHLFSRNENGIVIAQSSFSDPTLPLAGHFLQLPPEAEDWFVALPPKVARDILASNLFLFLCEGVVSTCLPWMLKHLPALRQTLDETPLPVFIQFDILAGRFAEAGRQIVPLLMDKNDPQGPAFLGMIAFFEGRNPEAVEHFLEARKRLRRQLNKRRIQLEGIQEICFILALIRTESPAFKDDIYEMLNAVQTLSISERHGFYAASALFSLASGKKAHAFVFMAHRADFSLREPFSAALFLALYALLLFDPDAQSSSTKAMRGALRERLLTYFALYRDVIPMTACMLAEALLRIETRTAPYELFLLEQKPDVLFLSFLENRETWERQFDDLEHALCSSESTGTKTPKVRKKRLAWLFDPDLFEINPLEQTSKNTKNGEVWTVGRVASLKRLCEQVQSLDWLTEQDRRILASAEWGHEWQGLVCYLNEQKALPELVGHPHVLHAVDRRPITLRREDVELLVRQKGTGYVLSLSRNLEDARFLISEEEPDDFCLHLLPERLEAVASILDMGLEIPQKGANRVLRLLRDHDPAISIRAEIQAREIAVADARPVVRLKPLGTGLEVSLLVRPFGIAEVPAPSNAPVPEGPVFPPGQGNPEPLAERDGTTLRARRDLDAEITAARNLCHECPALDEQGDLGPWFFDDTEMALQCLLELQAASGCAGLEWPEGETLRVRPAVSVAQLAVQVHSSRDWFQLQGQIHVNESLVLDMRQVLERLDEAKGCFVPLGDGAFLALTRQFRRQLERLRRLSEPAEARRPADAENPADSTEKTTARKNTTKTALRVHALGAAALWDILDEVGSLEADSAWHDLARRIREAGDITPVVPSTLRTELREYQYEGFAWLSRLSRWAGGACLADDMGLGKTVQTLAVLLEQAPLGPSVILAPTSVCHNWESEILRFAPTLTCHRFIGTKASRAELVRSLGSGDVLVVSYGLLHTETATLAAREWRMAVFDEAQALKNAETKRARASKQIPAVFRVALTGTPIENYLEDLWSLFNTICPGLLGTRQSFQRRFSGPIGSGRIETQGSGISSETGKSALGGTGVNEARQALKALVRPFILRRTKSAVLAELPPRTEQVITVELPEDERAMYEALRRKALDALEGSQTDSSDGSSRKFTILTELTRLRRACCHPALIDPHTQLKGAKLTAFMELVDELVRGGHKALVFSQFVGHLAQVRQALDHAGFKYQYLDGSTPERERQRAVKAFQSGEGDLFLISLKAGGQGLNLTAADYVVHLDPWWNPAVEDQASDRAHRIGQTRPVTVYRLVIGDSVEENILRLHRSKRSLAADFLEGADASAALSEQELLALIQGNAD